MVLLIYDIALYACLAALLGFLTGWLTTCYKHHAQLVEDTHLTQHQGS